MAKFMSLNHLITTLLLLITFHATSQEVSYEDGKSYILGGIEVTGL
ncbi:MAG: outer membrane protein insertion porin family, partial [Maribacter sp.]